jgi:hypothetical protein
MAYLLQTLTMEVQQEGIKRWQHSWEPAIGRSSLTVATAAERCASERQQKTVVTRAFETAATPRAAHLCIRC